MRTVALRAKTFIFWAIVGGFFIGAFAGLVTVMILAVS